MPPIESLSQVRKSHIRQVLDHAQGDLDLACRILGVSADDLRSLLATHGLERPQPDARPQPNPDRE